MYVGACGSVCTRVHMRVNVKKAVLFPDSFSDISTLLCTHTPPQSCPHPPPPSFVPPLWALPVTPTWMGLHHGKHRRPGNAPAPRSSKLITRRWACLFAWHALVSDCFSHPPSQLKGSQFILPARRDQIGSMHTHSQTPNIDFQLSFNFAPVFICSFHFFPNGLGGKKKKNTL